MTPEPLPTIDEEYPTKPVYGQVKEMGRFYGNDELQRLLAQERLDELNGLFPADSRVRQNDGDYYGVPGEYIDNRITELESQVKRKAS